MGLTSGVLDVGGPVYAVADGFAGAEVYGEGPEPLVDAEDLLEVEVLAHVVGAAVGLALLVEVLDGSLVCGGEEDVEAEEDGHEEGDDAGEDVADLDEDAADEALVVGLTACVVERVHLPLDGHHEFIE